MRRLPSDIYNYCIIPYLVKPAVLLSDIRSHYEINQIIKNESADAVYNPTLQTVVNGIFYYNGNLIRSILNRLYMTTNNPSYEYSWNLKAGVLFGLFTPNERRALLQHVRDIQNYRGTNIFYIS